MKAGERRDEAPRIQQAPISNTGFPQRARNGTKIPKGCLALQVARRQRKPERLAGAPNGLLERPLSGSTYSGRHGRRRRGRRCDSFVMVVFPRLTIRFTEEKAALRFTSRGHGIGWICDLVSFPKRCLRWFQGIQLLVWGLCVDRISACAW